MKYQLTISAESNEKGKNTDYKVNLDNSETLGLAEFISTAKNAEEEVKYKFENVSFDQLLILKKLILEVNPSGVDLNILEERKKQLEGDRKSVV